MKAECQCGQLHVELPCAPTAVVACHCIACQRRSGSPFGVLAQYLTDQVSFSGDARRYERPTDEGTPLKHSFVRIVDQRFTRRRANIRP